MATTREVLASSTLPRHEAERLLAVASGTSRTDLMLDVEILDAHIERFRGLESRRMDGEPLQYLEGDVPFGPVVIAVDARVLIPRPETEEMLALAVGLVDRPSVILDLCTGSGNLAIALAATFPDATVYATDLSADAVDAARENALRNGVDIRCERGDLFAPLPDELAGRIDLVVANPPYLSVVEMADLPPDVAREPRSALEGGSDGLDVVARIGTEVSHWLAPGAPVLCEVSEFHAQRAAALFASVRGEVRHDLYGKPRFVVGRAAME